MYMLFRNFFSTYTRYYLLFPITLLLGMGLGLILPTPVLQHFIRPMAHTLVQIMLYTTVPYFFFALVITTYELLSIQQYGGFLKIFFGLLMLLFIVIMIVGTVVIIFIPTPSLIPLVQNIQTIPTLSFTSLMEDLFPPNAFRVFSITSITPLLLVAVIIGIVTKATLPFKHPLLEVIKGLRTLVIVILQYLLPWFTLVSGILAIDKIGSIRDFSFLTNFLSIIIVLSSITLTLFFIIFPILLKILKIPISTSVWFSRVIPSTVVAFTSGNVVAVGGLLLYADLPNNPRRKIIDTVVSYSFVFGRIGVALVISVGYLFLYKIFNVETINIGHLIIMILYSILFSFAAGIVTFPIIAVGIATLSSVGLISIQELYIIIIPLVPLLSGFAASIDAACCNFLNLFVQHKMAQKYPTPFGTA